MELGHTAQHDQLIGAGLLDRADLFTSYVEGFGRRDSLGLTYTDLKVTLHEIYMDFLSPWS